MARDPRKVLQKRRFRLRRKEMGKPPKPHVWQEKRDPIESDPAYAEILADVDALLEKKFEGVDRDMGFCHLWWPAKKFVLMKIYGIDWKSPAELNPNSLYD